MFHCDGFSTEPLPANTHDLELLSSKFGEAVARNVPAKQTKDHHRIVPTADLPLLMTAFQVTPRYGMTFISETVQQERKNRRE